MRIKLEDLYRSIQNMQREVCEMESNEIPMSYFNEIDKMSANFKRLFWSLIKRFEKETNIEMDSLRWSLRNGDIVDFWWKYDYFFGKVPSWQRA